MNKTEFYEFVDSFNENYDEVNLLIIGKKFRELPVKQRCWQELVDYLGINKTANAFRQWVYRNEEHLDDILAQEIPDENEEQLTEVEPKPDNDSRYRQDYIMLTKNRDVLNTYRRLIREEARIETLKEAIVSTVNQLNDLPEMQYEENEIRSYSGTPNEAVMLISDLHIGVECNNFCNIYNSKIAEERLNKFVNDTIMYCKTLSVYRLNVLNLGDLIHGLIHTTARIEQEFDVVQQVMVASELLCKALNQLQKAAPEVIYRSVTDNHARTVANYKENIENENFYRLIDWYVEERLKNTNIKFDHQSNLDPSFVYFELLNGQTACAAHGHLDNINTSVQNFSGLTHTFVDNIFLAHYHDEKVKNFQGATVFVNGSIVGPEQYAISKRLVGYPTQKLIIYCESSRLDISIKLN